MSVVAKAYGLLSRSLLEGEIDLTVDSVKVMLCTSGYAPNQDTHRHVSDVTNEVVGTAYTAGGKQIAATGLSYTAATNTLVLDGNDVTWAASTITARYAVFYVDNATKPLLGWWDFESDEISSNGNFTLTLNPAGLLNVSTP